MTTKDSQKEATISESSPYLLLNSRKALVLVQQEPPFSNASMRCPMSLYALLRPTPTDLYALPLVALLGSMTTYIHVLVNDM